MNSDDDTPLDSLFATKAPLENGHSTAIKSNATGDSSRWQKVTDNTFVIKTDKLSLGDLSESNRNLIKGMLSISLPHEVTTGRKVTNSLSSSLTHIKPTN